MGTFLTAVGEGANKDGRPETPFSQYLKSVRNGEQQKQGGLAVPKPLPVPKLPLDQMMRGRKQNGAQQRQAWEAAKKAEMQIRKKTFEQLQSASTKPEGNAAASGSAMPELLRPASSTIHVKPMPPTRKTPAPLSAKGNHPPGWAFGKTAAGSVVPLSDPTLASARKRGQIETDAATQHNVSGIPSNSNCTLKPFDPNAKATPAHRPSTGMSIPKVLPAIPPKEAFQRPATSHSSRAPSAAASAVSVGRRTRNAQGVTTQEIKGGDSQFLSLEHDTLASDYRKQARDIDAKSAYKPPVDKFTNSALEKHFDVMEATNELMRQEAHAELLVAKPMTAHLQRQVEEASQMGKERMRTALLFEGGHDYPFTPKDLMAGHFNKVLQVLKDRVYQRGLASVSNMLEIHDLSRSGYLTLDSFHKAMEAELNMRVPPFVTEKLISLVGAARHGTNGMYVHYPDLIEKIRYNQLHYMDYTVSSLEPHRTHWSREITWSPKGPVYENGRKRLNPDLDLPFGNPNNKTPFAILDDATNGLKDFDSRLTSMFTSLEESFRQQDPLDTGRVGWPQFKESMEKLNAKRGLKLTKYEIANLYKFGEKDANGNFMFKPWLNQLKASEGIVRQRSVPEFLKPKGARCSVAGLPWQWNADPKESINIHKIGSLSFQHGPSNKARTPTWEDMAARPDITVQSLA